MLAVDVFIDQIDGVNIATIMDQSGLNDGIEVQEDNDVTLSFANMDVQPGEGAGAQDGLLITDPGGVNAIGPGVFQVDDVTAFIPEQVDATPGPVTNLFSALTETVIVDLQSGDDDLIFTDNVADVPVVMDYDIHGGDNGTHSDQLFLQGTTGEVESVSINPSSIDIGQTFVNGYAGVDIDVRGYESITYAGDNQDDDLTANLGAGVSTARVQSSAFILVDEVLSDTLPTVRFANLQTFVLGTAAISTTATFALDNLTGSENYSLQSSGDDLLVIEGTPDGDFLTASLDGTGDLQIDNGFVTVGTSNFGFNDLLRVDTLGGDDTLTVDVAGTELIDSQIFYDGGTGSDELIVQGDPTPDLQAIRYTPGIQPDEGRLEYDRNIFEAGLDMVIDFDNLEPVVDLVPAAILVVNGTDANNTMTYQPATVNDRGVVAVDGFESIEFQNKTGLQLIGHAGDDVFVIRNSNVPTGLETIFASGRDGADEIRFESVPNAATTSFVSATANGDDGNDILDGSAIAVDTPLTLLGGQGNDTLIGGASDDLLRGDGGDDTIIDSLGDDAIDGSAGNDTLVVRGTQLADVISVIQQAPTNVVGDPYIVEVSGGETAGLKEIATFNGGLSPADAGNVPSVERIVVEGLAGDDIIRAGHADEYSDLDAANGAVSQTIPFEVRGDSPNASDRLVVPDDGLGDLIIHRHGADQRSGSVTVGGMAPIDYSEIEFVNVAPLDPITAGTGTDGAGRLVVFKNDPFESNDTLPNATFLGAGPTVNVDPTIDPGGIPVFGVPGDNDFYQFVAQETGTLDLQIYFEVIDTLANGRPGLPFAGELVATVLDSDGAPISIATASDLLDPNGIKIGERVTAPVVRNNTYYLRVVSEVGFGGAVGINVYNFTAITTPAPIPELVDLQAASDSGRHDGDDITKITTPTFNIILDDDRIDEFMNIDLNPDTENDDAQTLNDGGGARIDYGVEVFNNAVSIGFAYFTGVGNTWEFTATAGDLNEGDFNHISAAVWIRDAADPAQIGRHELSQSLQVTLDTITPPVSFGLANVQNAEDGLAADSDSGVTTVPASAADRITSDTTPRLWGRAEADTIVSVYLDRNADGVVDLLTDTFLGQTVAVPLDGNNAFSDGYWEIVSALDLNEIVGLPKDGLRSLLVTAEDVAGNPMPMQLDLDPEFEIADGVDQLDIFIDTQGPQVDAVTVTDFPDYDLFDPKPSENGFSPLVDRITVHFDDFPERLAPDFLYEAIVSGLAEQTGIFQVVGDHVGIIAIERVAVFPVAPVNGQPATTNVDILFFDPLPDDRFTLTILDEIADIAGNRLDGESNTNEPLEDPIIGVVGDGQRSGNGVPGGDFVARFTIDSRPEIGSYVSQNIDIDINGNFVWDPANAQIGNDATNVDLTFTLGVANANGTVGLGRFGTHDLLFAGQFRQGLVAGPERLFDQLAAFGWSSELNARRWLVDTDSDGVITLGTDLLTIQPDIAGFDVAGALPVAGNFDNLANNGDEIGLYFAGQWAFDFNRNFVIEPAEVIGNNGLFGHPIIGDFDGDGFDDAAVFNNNVFTFDLAFNGFNGADENLVWGFPGVLDRPVAADMDQDGIDDIGLWVPRNSAQDNRPIAEWYFLLSDLPSNVVPVAGSISHLDHPFEPVPFGADIYAEFGDELALPIVGNFDPPVVAQDPTNQGGDDSGDFDQDGDVDGADFLAWQRGYGMTDEPSMSDGDGNSDGAVDYDDMALWSDAFGSGIVAAADVGDLAAWQDAYGAAVNAGAPGDMNSDGQVNGADFLDWQRGYTPETTSAVVAAAVSAPSALVEATSDATAEDLIALSSAYGTDSSTEESGAKEAVFENLPEAHYVDSSGEPAALTSGGPVQAVGSSVSTASQAEDDVWDLAFEEEGELLHGGLF